MAPVERWSATKTLLMNEQWNVSRIQFSKRIHPLVILLQDSLGVEGKPQFAIEDGSSVCVFLNYFNQRIMNHSGDRRCQFPSGKRKSPSPILEDQTDHESYMGIQSKASSKREITVSKCNILTISLHMNMYFLNISDRKKDLLQGKAQSMTLKRAISRNCTEGIILAQ